MLQRGDRKGEQRDGHKMRFKGMNRENMIQGERDKEKRYKWKDRKYDSRQTGFKGERQKREF